MKHLREILSKIGRDIETETIDPVYAVKLGGKTLIGSVDLEQYIKNVKALYPEQSGRVDNYIEHLIDFISGLNYARRTSRINPVVMARKYKTFTRYANKTVYDFMYDHFQDAEMILMLTALGNYTTSPLKEQSMLTFANIWAAHHLGEGMSLVKGGTNAMVDTLVDYINTNGGLFQVFLGIEERDGRGLENVTTFVLGRSHGNDVDGFFDGLNSWDLETITSAGVITVEGRENAPSGHRSINISSLIPYKHPQNWYIKDGDKTKYLQFKERIAAQLIGTMERECVPDLKDRIVVMETATPLTLERYTSATEGGLQGLAHTRDQSDKKRGDMKTFIKNLYQVGQYVFPGAGIVTVTMSGNMCADLILRDLF